MHATRYARWLRRLTLGNETYKTTCKDNAGGKNVTFEETLSFNKNMEENILKVVLSLGYMCMRAYMHYTHTRYTHACTHGLGACGGGAASGRCKYTTPTPLATTSSASAK